MIWRASSAALTGSSMATGNIYGARRKGVASPLSIEISANVVLQVRDDNIEVKGC